MDTLYDQHGAAIAYIDDDETSIYIYDGTPVAWVMDDSVYGHNGRYLGWIQEGWFYDRGGHPAFFTDYARGGPVKPARRARPARGARRARPARSAREARPARPACSLSWSDATGEAYFSQ
jgi:hypothetical protein